MTVEFRQDPLDGRRLTILSQGIPSSQSAPGSPRRFPSDSSASPVRRSRSAVSSAPSVYGFPDIDTSRDGGWLRILYHRNSQYPDNYTPPSFLSSLSINRDIRIYEYWPSVKDTLIGVVLTLCLIPIFFVVYVHLDDGGLTPGFMLVIDLTILVAGYVCREQVVRMLLESAPDDLVDGSLDSNPGPWSPKSVYNDASPMDNFSPLWQVVAGDMYQGVLVFGSVFVLSPLLRSLTHSWSTESIISIGIIMLIVHVIFHDYGFVSRMKTKLEVWQQHKGNRDRLIRSWKRVDTSLALNAIIFSAIVLASRLGSAETVFAFIFFAMAAFPFLPFVTKFLFLKNKEGFVKWVIPVMLLATLILIPSMKVRLVYIAVVATVVLLCPYLLILCLPLKNSIKGPWDIAHVRASSVNLPPTPTALLGPLKLFSRSSNSKAK
jgi:phosphatidylinositol N-acetylglucosaminyltransferase subunit C